MKITAATKVEGLLRAHPYLEEFLAGLNPKFEMLRNKAARATIGRLANLRAAAPIFMVDLVRCGAHNTITLTRGER